MSTEQANGSPPPAGVKVNYLIRRRPGVPRDELVANWFANHMPAVIAGMTAAAGAGRPHAHRYIATLFDPPTDPGAGTPAWDGVAQLWWDRPPPRPSEPHGTVPADTFQEKAEPYLPWATDEHVALDGALPVRPNTLNAPFPCTRGGFTKMTYLITLRAGVTMEDFLGHWRAVHAPAVAAAMPGAGGVRYALSTSREPDAPYSAMSELWFDTPDGPARLAAALTPDGTSELVDGPRRLVFRSSTEMIGIP